MRSSLLRTWSPPAIALVLVGFFAISLPADPPPPSASANPVDYLQEIRPILSKTCYNCHGPDEAERKAGLRLDQREAALATLESTARAIVPGNLAESELWARVTSDDPAIKMPPGDSPGLTPQQRDLLKRWIGEGARYAEHWLAPQCDRPLCRRPLDRGRFAGQSPSRSTHPGPASQPRSERRAPHAGRSEPVCLRSPPRGV